MTPNMKLQNQRINLTFLTKSTSRPSMICLSEFLKSKLFLRLCFKSEIYYTWNPQLRNFELKGQNLNFRPNRCVDSVVSPNKFLLSQPTSWFFKTPSYAILHTRAKVDIFAKSICRPTVSNHNNFYSQNEFPGIWILIYKLFQGQITNLKFPANRVYTLSRAGMNFFAFRFVIRRLTTPRRWIWLNYINVEIFLSLFFTTRLNSFKESLKVERSSGWKAILQKATQ